MKSIYIKFIFCSVLLSALSLHSCTLDEYNPGAFTKEALATSIDGYETLINQCYFAMERFYYGAADWMSLTEGDTDLWTYKANESTSYTQWFWFFAGTSPNTTYTNNWWNGTYDGVGACNEAIALGDKPPYTTEEERNAKIAEARFLRAVYYFNAVEQFGAVTMLTEPVVTETLTYSPTRTDPMTIYQEVILPDLRFASEWLPTGTHATTTTPTKKAALGFLAKACLQTYEYGSTEYLQEALDAAKKLITDCETGGGKYNTYMYPSYSEVFKESNNWENKEALWKHRWYAGADGHGSSNGNYKLNRNDEYFLCNINKFGAREDNQETRLTWEGSITGIFMPTQHLLSLYAQKDGTLDPRFHESFTTEWNANKNYTWDESAVHMYDKEETVIGKALNAAVKKIVADINQRPFQKKSDIRKSRMNGFEKYDKPRMNQLPGESYTLCDYKYFLKVPDNYHLEYDAHYYSVLYTYKGKPAILKATMTEIRICDEYNRLICRHPRSYRDFPLYITDDNHMPPEHLYYKEVNAHDGAYYRRWASVYGESMVTLIDRILRSSKHEEQAYNSCAGVLHSCKDVPHRLVQEAAEKCVEANACKYSYFKKVLSMVQNNHSSSAINGTGKLPSHTNIRGKEAYK